MKTKLNILALIALSATLAFAQNNANSQKTDAKSAAAPAATAKPAATPAKQDANAKPAAAPAKQDAKAKPAAQQPAKQDAKAKPAAQQPAKQDANAKPAAQQPAKQDAKAAAPAPTSKTEAKAPADTAKAKPAAKPEAKAAAKPDDDEEEKEEEISDDDSLEPNVHPAKIKRHKKTYKSHMDSLKHEAAVKDSITYHHGVSVSGGRLHDKDDGRLHTDNKWGGSFGFYYFYRYYFTNWFAMQGRFGGLYRYSRFREYSHFDKKVYGEEFTLSQRYSLNYENVAVDMPLEFKLGGHVEATTFMYVGVTFGCTKPIVERVFTKNALFVENASDDFNRRLEILDKEGLSPFPYADENEHHETFFADDWETNLWAGVGIDGKYLSVEGQAFIIGASTKDNHRFMDIFHKAIPTWRFMIDFSMR